MMKNNKAVELSLNMLVVIILGIVILGVGLTTFYKIHNKVGGITDQVDAQTQSRLNALLDDGAPIVVLMNTKEGGRGEKTVFSIGVHNNLLEEKDFKLTVSYGRTTAAYDPDPFRASIAIGGAECTTPPETCGNAWILGGERSFSLEPNEREFYPVQITVPKRNIQRGQYIFNVDVLYKATDSTDDFIRFSSRQKLYVTIN